MPIQITLSQNGEQHEIVCDSMDMENDGAITVYRHGGRDLQHKKPQVVTIQNAKIVSVFQPINSYYSDITEMHDDGIECMEWSEYILLKRK